MYSTQAYQLLQEQLGEWPLAQQNFEALKQVLVRQIDFDGFVVKIQFNPSRMVSSAAKVDAHSIQQRKCFLCAANQPAEQRELPWADYRILVNPFPIFPQHFTIPLAAHVPQRIDGRVGQLLGLAQALEGYTIFYNGPKCGASAPDHFHFQAGNEGFLPIEAEMDDLKTRYGRPIETAGCPTWAVNDGLRRFFVLESADVAALQVAFDQLIEAWPATEQPEDEAPMNLLARFVRQQWQLILFPRGKHRPWQFFAEGDQHIMLSPASVDMGGVLITPMLKDFEKMTRADIESIFDQVCLSADAFEQMCRLRVVAP